MSDKPNILILMTDHLSPNVIGAYGDTRGATPHIDRIAAQGVTFGRAYTTYPLCQPARASFWTGRLPHETRVLSNGRQHVNGPLPEGLVTLGDVFSRGGYQAIHFGKQHDFGTLRGFELVALEQRPSPTPPHPAWPENRNTTTDNATVQQVEGWLAGRQDERPFIAVADLVNPHNICAWVGENSSMDGPVTNVPIPGELPPLPDNFEVTDLSRRPLPVQYICCSHNRLAMGAKWTNENYRHYIAAYTRYSTLVDQAIGKIVEALHATPAGENTLLLVMADHGDGQGCHRMVTKQVSFYDETNRVPFIFAGPGVARRDGVENRPLISLLDLAPTLCDYAGLAQPQGLRGKSLWPILQGQDVPHHAYVAGEWHTEWGFTISPGRMIRTDRYKYTRYPEGAGEELYDMVEDPGETRTLIDDPVYRDVLDEHRRLLDRHLAETADDFELLDVAVDPRWRSHDVGYPNHQGPSAPMLSR